MKFPAKDRRFRNNTPEVLKLYVQYSLPLRFDEGDFTPGGCVRPSVILHAFQDIAKAHAQSAGIGFEPLMARNLIWVVMKLRFILRAQPRPGEECTLLSFPRRTGSLIYDRDFHILSPEGAELVTGASQWCVVNFVTRHAEQTDVDFKGEYNPEPAIPEGIPRVRPRDLVLVSRHVVTPGDMDENGHTNNCRYADMALETLGLDSVSGLTLNFASETRLGDEIELYRGPDGIAAGKCGGSLVFAARAE